MYFSIMFLENGNLIIQSQVLRLEREEGGQVLHKLWRRTLTFYKSLLEIDRSKDNHCFAGSWTEKGSSKSYW